MAACHFAEKLAGRTPQDLFETTAIDDVALDDLLAADTEAEEPSS